MALLIKILTDDDGQPVEVSGWCAVKEFGDSRRTLCTGDVFGYGESGGITFEEKSTGKVTCERCIKILQSLKKYKY